MKKDIIILAAGIGSRLRPLTDEIPKCMVKVNGRPIIERILTQIADSSIEKNIFVVTGYKEDVLKSFITALGIPVTFIENTDYNSTNNMFSLNLALKKTDPQAGLVIINADCVYEDDIVSNMLLTDDNFIAVDKSIFNEESMKVSVDSDGFIMAMSKAISEAEGNFVSMDIYSFDQNLKEKLLNVTTKVISDGDLNSWTEVAIDMLAKAQRVLRPFDCSTRKWMEIDDHGDLSKAEQIFK
ncbi:sugar phosphate nucleotidyltransferase [Pedobacter sp. SAFR-022]|uniref:phosphocholine cytidylyltransferase family protein n=1 Tax=Pedobacter sp. SAFR-022 TaxID=3436861 RepID=UPI003F7F09BB